MDQMEKAYVTYVIDPLMFWARIGHDGDLDSEKQMEDLISDYVLENLVLADTDDLVLKQNQVILARSSDYDRWLRATVVTDVSSCSCSEVDVVFPGYGSNELVTWKDIMTSVPDYILEWNRSAECFELDAIHPSSTEWSDEAVKYFDSLVVGKTLPCQRIVSKNLDVPDRLIIYSSDDRVKTIQGALVDKGFARWLFDGHGDQAEPARFAYPFSTSSKSADKTGGRIPEFNAAALFFENDSSLSPPPSEFSAKDFEMEEHKKFLNSSSAPEFPTRTDDVYLGLRPREFAKVESFVEKVENIREEIARVGRTGRQLVRPNGGRLPPRSYVQSPNCQKSDWKSPHNSPRNSPRHTPQESSSSKKKNNNRTLYESMSFKSSLQEHLSKSKDLDTIRQYLRPILDEDNLTHDRLFLCISAITDHQLKVENDAILNFQVLDSLKAMNGFSDCLGNVIQQINKAYMQIASTPSTEIKTKLKPFAEFLAHVMQKFHDMPEVVGRVLSIAENWTQCCNDVKADSQLCEVCATCLKHFVSCLATQSTTSHFEDSLKRLMIEVKEKLFSNSTSRTVKEILLEILLHVERLTAAEELMQKITSHSDVPVDLSHGDFAFNGNISSSCGNSVEKLYSPSSEFHSATNASISSSDANENSPVVKTLKSPQNVAEEVLSNDSSSKMSPVRKSKRKNTKKNKIKMSLAQYHAKVSDAPSVASSDGLEETSDGQNSVQPYEVMCVLCGTKDDHDSANCPDRINNFFI